MFYENSVSKAGNYGLVSIKMMMMKMMMMMMMMMYIKFYLHPLKIHLGMGASSSAESRGATAAASEKKCGIKYILTFYDDFSNKLVTELMLVSQFALITM